VSLECPSLWRVYEYLSDRGRQEVCEVRAAAAKLSLLEGGAAYIAADEWCYFCGESGHLGDVSRCCMASVLVIDTKFQDCPDSKYAPYRPEEPSAFGIYNLQTGPFSDVQYGSGSRGRRQWEEDRSRAEEFVSDRGRDPGRKGKEKRMKGERERARRRDLEEEEVEEEDDWFGRRRRESRHDGDHRKREHGSERQPKMSLMMRMQIPEEVKQPGRESDRKRGRTGPQYHGGYTR
jgi:protein AIR1/2